MSDALVTYVICRVSNVSPEADRPEKRRMVAPRICDSIVVGSIHTHGDRDEVFSTKAKALYDLHACQATLAANVGHSA